MISKQLKFIEDNDIGLTNQNTSKNSPIVNSNFIDINMFLGDDEEEEVPEEVEADDDEIDVNIGVVEEKNNDYIHSDST